MDRMKILEMIKNEPYKIGHFVGFKDLTTLHNEWLKSFLFAKEDQTLLAHRGSYKTTDLSLFLAIHTVICPHENVIFFRKTDTDVTEVIRQARKILHSGCMMEVCRTLYKGYELKLVKETDSEIDTNLNTGTKGVSQVVGLGIGTSITGKHADIVITDDIVNLKDRVSRAEREKTKTQYMELQNIVNRTGRIINTGTPWHKEDAISLMPNVKRYDCYSTGLIDAEKLKKIRSSMTDSLFAANYELKHIADKDAVFRSPVFESGETTLYGGSAHIDAAYGGSDWTAYTIMKKTENGFVALGKIWNRHVDDCLSEIEVLHRRYQAGSVACERNADKGYLAKELSRRGFICNTYQESMNKFVKISSYLRKAWTSIRWLDETDPEYMNMILDYTEHSEHDDAPDSAASLVRILEKSTKVKVKAFKGGI